MNRSFLVLLPVIGVAVLLGGCEQAKEALGKGKRSPDEFAVYQRAPLSVPPSFTLRPPAPGQEQATTDDPTSVAKQAVFGTTQVDPNAPATYDPTPAAGSAGLQSLLREVGAVGVDPNIRSTINRETSIMVDEDKSFTERIITWGKPIPPGTVVDPDEEAKRIQANQALGRPITEGDTPIIKREERGLLEGLF